MPLAVVKRTAPARFVLRVNRGPTDLRQTGLTAAVEVPSLGEIVQPLVLQQPRANYTGPFIFEVRVEDAAGTFHLERDVQFLGCSIIVGSDGWPLQGPAGPEEEALLIADVDLDAQGTARHRTPRNDLFGDRRPDSYNAVVVRPPRPSGAATTPTAP